MASCRYPRWSGNKGGRESGVTAVGSLEGKGVKLVIGHLRVLVALPSGAFFDSDLAMAVLAGRTTNYLR